jgi:hypothetical protein
MTISVAGLIIEQSTNGLYSINDLHKASGGLAKHRPENWFRLQATINFIRYQEEKAKSQALNPCIRNLVLETAKGNGKQQGTFVSRKLVVAYAMWISPAFADHVLETFLDVVDGIYERVNAQNKVIEQQALQLDLFGSELKSMRKRDPRSPETLPVLTGMEARKCKPMFDKLVDDGYLTASEYYPARIQYKPTQKAMDAGIISGVKNRTVLFNPDVLQILGL